MSGMRKLLLLINSDTTMSTSADLAKKASQNRPVYRNNPRDFSPRKAPKRDLSRDSTAHFKGRCISLRFTACLRQLWPQSMWFFLYTFACKGSKLAACFYLGLKKIKKLCGFQNESLLLESMFM